MATPPAPRATAATPVATVRDCDVRPAPARLSIGSSACTSKEGESPRLFHVTEHLALRLRGRGRRRGVFLDWRLRLYLSRRLHRRLPRGGGLRVRRWRVGRLRLLGDGHSRQIEIPA